jgi:hypothetical protein
MTERYEIKFKNVGNRNTARDTFVWVTPAPRPPLTVGEVVHIDGTTSDVFWKVVAIKAVP